MINDVGAPNNCPDLCTAAKCEELERRISALEQAVELLEASFEAHTNQDIPTAHDYRPDVSLDGAIGNGKLVLNLRVDRAVDTASITIPDPDLSVTFDILPIDDRSYEFQVSVNGESDRDILQLNSNDDALDVSVGFTSNDELEVSVQLGDRFATDSTALPNSNVSVDVFNIDESGAVIKVSVGNNSDEDIIFLPQVNQDSQDSHEPSNLKISASYQSDILTITVADGESQDTAQVFIDADVVNRFGGGGSVSCDALSQELENCCAQILGAIADLAIRVQQVENEVTIDISGTVNGDYECIENAETKMLEPSLTAINYANKGFLGIHENLKIINSNLDAIFKPLCELENNAMEVVSLVPADIYIPKASGKYLVLHFVELENYPKRKRGSSLWSVTIPAAKEEYVWADDFEEMRFNRGNQFAKLYFNEFSSSLSGFFVSKAAADSYFNAVLGLTTATEKNRSYSEHDNPQTNVSVRQTRPYRAFIESVNGEGKVVCHVKYVPDTENAN